MLAPLRLLVWRAKQCVTLTLTLALSLALALTLALTLVWRRFGFRWCVRMRMRMLFVRMLNRVQHLLHPRDDGRVDGVDAFARGPIFAPLEPIRVAREAIVVEREMGFLGRGKGCQCTQHFFCEERASWMLQQNGAEQNRTNGVKVFVFWSRNETKRNDKRVHKYKCSNQSIDGR